MKKQDWLNDVMSEIDSLKENATPEELNNLNFKDFDYSRSKQCIYGQMTGHCDSERAKQLMDASCIRVLDLTKSEEIHRMNALKGKSFTSIKPLINGPFDVNEWNRERTHYFMSSLEAYIATKGAKNKNIIEYLKGERNTLEL